MAEFNAFLALLLGNELRDLARRESKSKTLAESLEVEVGRQGVVRVGSPYYWARWYHDGRGPVRARPGHKLVYFKDPAQDPRLRGGYPRRRRDVRRLTKAQFYRYLRDPSSGMIVTDRVGPWEGDPFFVRAARRFKVRAPKMARQQFSAHVLRELRDVLSVRIEETLRL